MRKRQKILIIVGPTASGKSALAVELARKFNGEIISADSRQVFQGLDIGTGKITKREMKGVRHHLLDIASPKRTFTAHDFVLQGRKAITTIYRSNHLPIIVGGTGFYIDALVERIPLPNVPANPKLRSRLEKKTAAQLFELLKKRNPRRAKTIDRHNKRRLIRALEIAAAPREREARPKMLPFDILWLGIAPKKKKLEEKIQRRLTVRIKQGMVAEARHLHANGLSYKRMEELGLEYRFMARLLQKKLSRKEFEEQLFRAIKQYAKRQMTYWRRNKDIRWLAPSDKRAALSKVKAFVRNEN